MDHRSIPNPKFSNVFIRKMKFHCKKDERCEKTYKGSQGILFLEVRIIRSQKGSRSEKAEQVLAFSNQVL